MTPNLQAAGLNDRRFKQSGMTVDQAHALAEHLLAFAQTPRTKDELLDHLAQQHGSPIVSGVWRALRMYPPLWHAPTGDAWTFGRTAQYRRAADPTVAPVAKTEALSALIRRYLQAFGPATISDFAQYTMIRQSVAKPAFRAIGHELTTYTCADDPRRQLLYDLSEPLADAESGSEPGGDGGRRWGSAEIATGDEAAPPRLLPMWESVLLAYADRSRVIDDNIRAEVIRRNGDVLASVLVDGRVVGMWRAQSQGIEITALAPISADAWDQLADEAAALGNFLADRNPTVYQRYGHWWAKRVAPGSGSATGEETRLLPFR